MSCVAVTTLAMIASSVVPTAVDVPVCLVRQWPPSAPPSSDNLAEESVPLSPSARGMVRSPLSNAGTPLGTAGVWRALAVDQSVRG